MRSLEPSSLEQELMERILRNEEEATSQRDNDEIDYEADGTAKSQSSPQHIIENVMDTFYSNQLDLIYDIWETPTTPPKGQTEEEPKRKVPYPYIPDVGNQFFTEEVMKLARCITATYSYQPYFIADMNKLLLRATVIDRLVPNSINVTKHREQVAVARNFCRDNATLFREFQHRFRCMQYQDMKVYLPNSEYIHPWGIGLLPAVKVIHQQQPFWTELTLLQEERKVMHRETTMDKNFVAAPHCRPSELLHDGRAKRRARPGYIFEELSFVTGDQFKREFCYKTPWTCECEQLDFQNTDLVIDVKYDIGKDRHGTRVLMGEMSERLNVVTPRRLVDAHIGGRKTPKGGNRLTLNKGQFLELAKFKNGDDPCVVIKVTPKSTLLKTKRFMYDEQHSCKMGEEHFNFHRFDKESLNYCASQFFIKTLAAFQLHDHIVTLTPYYQDGSVLDILNLQKKPFELDTCQGILRDVILGVSYMHSHLMVHRNLNLSNLFVHDGHIKIGGFSLIRPCDAKKDHPYAFCAENLPCERVWPAPEIKYKNIINQKYGLPSDMWDVGVMAYHLIFGKLPEKEYKLGERLQFPPEAQHVCRRYLGLMESLLIQEPMFRPRPFDVMNHDFFDMDIDDWYDAWSEQRRIRFNLLYVLSPWKKKTTSLNITGPDPELKGRHYYHLFRPLANLTGFIEDAE